MKINIVPVSVFVPASGSTPAGLITATQVEVKVVSLNLGQGAVFGYELQAVVPPAAGVTPPPPAKIRTLAAGSYPLTAAQFAEWGTDDTAVAAASIANIGLTAAP
jgi:hypothetical protein